jgi:hypothetical protein
MLATGIIGGTLAWLVDQTDSVVNTFTYGDINIDLEETPTPDDDDNPDTNEYEMIPGEDVVKDPKVTVKEDSKANWLFVKLDKSENFDDFMEYEMAAGWIPLKDAQGEVIEGVYYREVPEVVDEDIVYEVIKDNKVRVKETVTKEMLNALDPEGADATYPTLTVTAYAVQRSGFEPVISEGATAPTAEQVLAAAFAAWNVIEA